MSNTQQCEHCFAPLPTNTFICDQCAHVSSRFNYKSRVAAAALALFGGALGLHRFYLGQWRGVLYLLFCWTPLPWLVAVVECIVFMTTNQRQWNYRYNQGIGNGRESARVLAAFMITGFLLIAGVLIASLYIPFRAFSDLSGLQNQLGAAQTLAEATQQYMQRTGRRPAQLSQLALSDSFIEQYGQHIQIMQGRISMQITPNGSMTAGSLILEPVIADGDILWDCSQSTVPQAFYPAVCK